jgi:hypothetical protein
MGGWRQSFERCPGTEDVAGAGASLETPPQPPDARKAIHADGSFQDVAFDVEMDRSSWVALRIYSSSHTDPVFVIVGGEPIRASRRPAEWCLEGVDRCWSQKEQRTRPEELAAAREAYDVARRAYRMILEESAED